MRESFVSLQELYSNLKFDIHLEGNPCGDCFACCSAENMTIHKVGALEMDYLEQMVGKEKTDLFRAYVARETDDNGELVHKTCPNYDGKKCTIHTYRPYSCRLYGMVRTDAQTLIPGCVFEDKVAVIPAESETELMPGHKELAKLQVDYLLRYGAGSEPVGVSGKPTTTDPISLGNYYLSQGEFEEAVEVMEAADREAFSGVALWALGQAYQGVERYQDSLECYREAVGREPDNPTFLFDLGTCLYCMGRWQEAAEAFEKAVELNPERASAHGMLGVCRLGSGDPELAQQSFEQCLEKESDPTVFRFQLARLLHGKGRLEEARTAYRLALECPITAEDAAKALEELA